MVNLLLLLFYGASSDCGRYGAANAAGIARRSLGQDGQVITVSRFTAASFTRSLFMFGNDIPPQKFSEESVGRIVVGFYAVLIAGVLGGVFAAGFLLGRWTG